MTIAFNDWLTNIASAYSISVDNVSVTDTADEFIAYLTPPIFTRDAITAAESPSRNIVELRIAKSEITP